MHFLTGCVIIGNDVVKVWNIAFVWLFANTKLLLVSKVLNVDPNDTYFGQADIYDIRFKDVFRRPNVNVCVSLRSLKMGK